MTTSGDTHPDDERWLARAIELATLNVASGGGPFGAVIVRGGEMIAEGQNRVTATLDPTAHAEVVAIREACQAIGDFSLASAAPGVAAEAGTAAAPSAASSSAASSSAASSSAASSSAASSSAASSSAASSSAATTLYASCEPCPLCLSAALWARVDRVVYAADRDDAARGGFDDREFYDLFSRDRSTWHIAIESLRLENSPEPFNAWLAHEHRTHY